jgi:hypothetical protein
MTPGVTPCSKEDLQSGPGNVVCPKGSRDNPPTDTTTTLPKDPGAPLAFTGAGADLMAYIILATIIIVAGLIALRMTKVRS